MSVRSTDLAGTKALQRLVYLLELERQAAVFNDNFEFAWRRASDRAASYSDQETWSALQTALFSAIVVQRLLKPGRVRKYYGLSQADSQRIADERAAYLRSVVEAPDDDDVLLRVSAVRNAFEHIDEKLDEVLNDDVLSLSDWYIIGPSGIALGSNLASDPARRRGKGRSLRAFLAAGGVLFFGDTMIDMFALDISMLEVRRLVKAARREAEASFVGRAGHSSQITQLMDPDVAAQRAGDWVAQRELLLESLGADASD